MGITSLIGMLISFLVIVAGILITAEGDFSRMKDFANLPSVVLVVVPTVFSVVSSFPLSLVSQVPAHFKIIMGKGYELENYIEAIINMAKKARSEGILSLESEKVDDPYMAYALRLVVDGVDETTIRNSLEDVLEGTNSRHSDAIKIYEKAASFAPAFGMCATVVALVIMLTGLDFTDPKAIEKLGPSMAMALITTLYGSVVANVFCIPIASRLKALHNKEILVKTIIGNAFLAIQRGDNPGLLQASLIEQLTAKSKKRFNAASGGGEAK